MKNKSSKKSKKFRRQLLIFSATIFAGICVFGFHKIKTKPIEIAEKKETTLRRIPMAFSVEDPENEILFEFSDPEDIFN